MDCQSRSQAWWSMSTPRSVFDRQPAQVQAITGEQQNSEKSIENAGGDWYTQSIVGEGKEKVLLESITPFGQL
jgi:hypothetical protein